MNRLSKLPALNEAISKEDLNAVKLEYYKAKDAGIEDKDIIIEVLANHLGMESGLVEKCLKKLDINESTDIKPVASFEDILDDLKVSYKKINADTISINNPSGPDINVRVMGYSVTPKLIKTSGKAVDAYMKSITAEFKEKPWFKDLDLDKLRADIDDALINDKSSVATKVNDKEYLYVSTDKKTKDYGFGLSDDGTEAGIGPNSYTWVVINESNLPVHFHEKYGRLRKVTNSKFISLNEHELIETDETKILEEYFSTNLQSDLSKGLKKISPKIQVKWKNKKNVEITGISPKDYDSNQKIIQMLNTYCVDGWTYNEPSKSGVINFRKK